MQAIRSIRSIRLVGYVASRTTSNSRRGALLLRYPPARQSRNCPSLPPRTDQPHLAAPRRPRQGLWPHPAPQHPANGYAAMDERRAIKTCANPEPHPWRPPSGRASALFGSPAW